MNQQDWRGVFPALTTAFAPDGSVDHAFVKRHVEWMIDTGSRGIVALGSLGEGGCLSHEEKSAVLATCVDAAAGRVPVVAGVAALTTSEAVHIAQEAERRGCEGLMVLPPYVYKGTWRENRAHFGAVMEATGLSCMLYNNPIAYTCDVVPEQLAELAGLHASLHAVKESSADVRRIAGIKAVLGERMAVFVGVDDVIVEGVLSGAIGWVAGLVNAMPVESVKLFDLAVAGKLDEAWELYYWFLPLLRLDTVPDFVQYIKLCQEVVGMGSARVRAPRLEFEPEQAERTKALVRDALARRPV